MKALLFLYLIFVFVPPGEASPGGFCSQGRFSHLQEFTFSSGAAEFANMNPLIFSVDTSADEALAKEELPREWDWRNHQDQNWLTSVKRQHSCGDCVMHAVASVFESQLKINSGWSQWEPQLSINEGFHCGGGDCTNGWWAQEALHRGLQMGFLDNACGQHVSSSQDCSQKECSTSSQRRWKLQGFEKITDGTLDINAIRRALLHGPVLTGLTLPEDFACYRWGVYKRAPGVGFRNVGHMMAIVGFSAKRKAWIVKNSWGNEWANQGYGYLYVRDTTNFGTESWSLQLPQSQGAIIENLKNGDLLSGKNTLTLRDLSGHATELSLQLKNEESELSYTFKCMGPLCSIPLDTTQIKDGSYEIFVTTNGLMSMVKTIQILNGPTLWAPLREIQHSTVFQNSPLSLKRPFKWTLPIPFVVKPTRILARFVTDVGGVILLEQKTSGISTKLHLELNPQFIPKGSKLLEFWFEIHGHPPFLYHRIKLAQ